MSFKFYDPVMAIIQEGLPQDIKQYQISKKVILGQLNEQKKKSVSGMLMFLGINLPNLWIAELNKDKDYEFSEKQN